MLRRTLLALAFVLAGTSCVSWWSNTSSEDDVNFIFFGDSGSGDQNQFDVANGMKTFCGTNTCNFALMMGDNFYNDGVSSTDDPQWQTKFLDPYSPLGILFYVVLGNHDAKGNIQAQKDYTQKLTQWYMPDYSYTFKKGNVEFFAVNTEGYDLKEAVKLTEALKKSRAEWKVVYGHRPIFSYGEHGPSYELVAFLLPILEDNYVDFYLSGHDHDKQLIDVGNMAFAVSGAAAKLTDTRTGPGTKFASSTLGFSHLSFSGDTAVIKFLEDIQEIVS